MAVACGRVSKVNGECAQPLPPAAPHHPRRHQTGDRRERGPAVSAAALSFRLAQEVRRIPAHDRVVDGDRLRVGERIQFLTHRLCAPLVLPQRLIPAPGARIAAHQAAVRVLENRLAGQRPLVPLDGALGPALLLMGAGQRQSGFHPTGADGVTIERAPVGVRTVLEQIPRRA